jgi:hypothetical protein
MEYPSVELVRLMQQFVPQFRRDYPILISDHQPLSIDGVLQGLHAVFAPTFGVASVTASLAVPVDYLAYLTVVEGTLTDSVRSRVFSGRQGLVGGTRGNMLMHGDPPPPPDTMEIWQTEDGREVVLPHSGATVQLDERRIWLSIGEEGERIGAFLCGDRRSEQYGWVVLEEDDHPWFRHTTFAEYPSFLAYLRHIVSSDARLVHLLERMHELTLPPL